MAKQTTKKKPSTFTICARIKVEVGIEIPAETFEEALAEADNLKILDFITIKGELWDRSGPQIQWISRNQEEAL